MGHGHIFRCKKCGYELKPHLGVGFLFPKVYQETIEAAKEGQYGKMVQEFLEEHPDGALNCDEVLLQCIECGDLQTGKDLSMYVPKQRTESKESGRWSVAFPFESATYVAPWDLEDYELIPSSCGSWRKRTGTATASAARSRKRATEWCS